MQKAMNKINIQATKLMKYGENLSYYYYLLVVIDIYSLNVTFNWNCANAIGKIVK